MVDTSELRKSNRLVALDALEPRQLLWASLGGQAMDLHCPEDSSLLEKALEQQLHDVWAKLLPRLKRALLKQLGPLSGQEENNDRFLDELATLLAQQLAQPAKPPNGAGELPPPVGPCVQDLLSHACGKDLRNGGQEAGTSQAFVPNDSRSAVPPAVEDFLPSTEDQQREFALIRDRQLSPELAYWAQRYSEVGKRNGYLWRWCRHGVELTSLSCLDPLWRDDVCDTKVLGIMFNVLLDDVADQNGENSLLEQLLSIPFGGIQLDFSGFSPELQAYAKLTLDVWTEIHRRIIRYPCFEAYAELLRYDHFQLFNSMRYSHLVNRNLALLNLVEHDLYLSHQMNMMISATFDLICSPQFDSAELGKLRQAIWHAQCMGRIGNLTTTWERELSSRDYTSGVYARAVDRGDLTVRDLQTGPQERIRDAIRNGGHEAYFLRRWQEHRQALLSQKSQIRSVDLGKLIGGLQRLISTQLGSRGYL